MLFNSIDFAIFLPIVFSLYWFGTSRNIKLQNFLLLIASYVFYGWWDWRFLSLIIISSFTDYFVGICLSKTDDFRKRKILLFTSISVNLGFLGFFKYYNFFLENFVDAFSLLGHKINPQGLDIILPVGISFYTFQTLSYSIDVYKRKIESTTDIISFFTFVSFFPQLVAGPIERAKNLLPQFQKMRRFQYDSAVDGMRQILWGLFKKIVIADNCAIYVNDIFANYTLHSGSTLLLGGVFFAFQIYGDFSGYSDIAIGTARLFGFDLMKNFNFPYFSRDIAEFWRRWHISLTTWFRDYLYIPLGGSRCNLWKQIRNVFVIFLVSGFWHGANWTFIFWGALNAIYFLPLLLLSKNRDNISIVAQDRVFPSFKDFLRIINTFTLTVFAWIFFRSENLGQAFGFISEIFSNTLFTIPIFTNRRPFVIISLLIAFIFIEWIGRRKAYAIAILELNFPKPIRWGLYYCVAMTIFLFGAKQQQFIYFQF